MNSQVGNPIQQTPVQPGPRIPEQVLEHGAVLHTRAGRPFSVLREAYTHEVLAFPPPSAP